MPTDVVKKTTFLCGYPGCGQSFKSSVDMDVHEKYHKTRGEYTCPECLARGFTNTFSRAASMASHRRSVHGIVGVTPVAIKEREKNVAKGTGKPLPGATERIIEANEAERQIDAMQFVQQAVPDQGFDSPEGQTQSYPQPVMNGKLESMILETMQPLLDHYFNGQTRLVALDAEREQIIQMMHELYPVLSVVPGVELDELPVQGKKVEFKNAVSEGMRAEVESWVRNRKTKFTVKDAARGVGRDQSTVREVIYALRADGMIRLIGKQGRSMVYTSTVGAE